MLALVFVLFFLAEHLPVFVNLHFIGLALNFWWDADFAELDCSHPQAPSAMKIPMESMSDGRAITF